MRPSFSAFGFCTYFTAQEKSVTVITIVRTMEIINLEYINKSGMEIYMEIYIYIFFFGNVWSSIYIYVVYFGK